MAELKYLTVSLTEEEQESIFSRISKDPVTGCWNWMGGHSGDGYAAIYYRGKTYAAHRFMYAWLVGPIPTVDDAITNKGKDFMELDHDTCNNRGCVNPEHVKLVTTKVNVLRGNGPSAQNARKTHCKYGHPLPTEDNRSDGPGRVCVECGRRRSREYVRAHKQQRSEYAKANREKINARRRQSRKEHPPTEEQRRREAERVREWSKKHPKNHK